MRHEPKQARSRKTRQALMAALDSLLKKEEFSQIKVTEIASLAGVSNGLLYAHFKNKADFLNALIDAYKARIEARLEEVEAEDIYAEYKSAGGLRQALQMISHFAYQQLLEDAHIIRAISQHLRSSHKADQDEWQALRKRASRTIIPILDVYAAEIARPDHEQTAKTLVYFFNTIFIESLIYNQFGTENSQKQNPDILIKEVAELAYGYLTTAPE